MCIPTCACNVYTYACVCVRVHVCVNKHTYTDEGTQTHMRTRMRTHMRTHTQGHRRLLQAYASMLKEF